MWWRPETLPGECNGPYSHDQHLQPPNLPTTFNRPTSQPPSTAQPPNHLQPPKFGMRQFLNSWEMLSQSFLNQYTLFLVLGTVRFFLSMHSLVKTLASARGAALVLCSEVQKARSAADQIPAKSAQAIALLVDGFADQIWRASRLSLWVAIQIMKGLIGFFIDVYLGTFTCLLTATIKGILDLIADVLKEVTQTVETVVNTFIDEFQDALSAVSSVINTVLSGIEAIKSLFSSDSDHVSDAVTKLNLTISDLKDIHISTNYTTKIEALANDIPDFSDLLANVTDVLTLPLTNFASHLDRSFSVPSNITRNFAVAEPSYSSCSQLDSLLSRALSDFQTSITYATISLSILTFLIILVSAVITFVKNKNFTNLLNELSFRDSPVDIGNALQNHSYGLFRHLLRNLKPRTLWLFSFMTTSNLYSVLSVAMVAAITALIQICLISSTQSQLASISSNLSSANSTNTSRSLHSLMNDMQLAVNQSTSIINTKLLGGMHSGSEELVEGITTFQNTLNQTIFSVFGTSFLAGPFETIVYCTVGRKVDSIKKGIVWFQNNTVIDSPQINQKAQLSSLFTYTPSEVDTMKETVGILQNILHASKKSVLVECYISAAFFAIWCLYLCAGIAVSFCREKRPAISWPSRMPPEAQKQYQYPFNDLGEKEHSL